MLVRKSLLGIDHLCQELRRLGQQLQTHFIANDNFQCRRKKCAMTVELRLLPARRYNRGGLDKNSEWSCPAVTGAA
jgi:hypothetical protein